MNLSALVVRLRAAFWLVPAACVLAALIAAPLIAGLDALVSPDGGMWFGGGAESARQILGVIAASVLTFAGLVFSITIVALQLASTQFSPRVLRTFLRDRYTQVSLGLFIGTFNFALLTLREVRGGDAVGGEFDIAERAISPAVNDPTTAVQCIDRIHALLRRIATRDLAVGNHVVDGVLRLRVPMPDWMDYIGLACDELRHWAATRPASTGDWRPCFATSAIWSTTTEGR